MINKKQTGSFYTPKKLADFLVKYLENKTEGRQNLSVLEPSMGDGVFVSSAFSNQLFASRIKKLIGVEISKTELDKVSIKQAGFCPIHSDFLEYQKKRKQKFSVVIGNPPYIKKSFLSKEQIQYCKEIHKKSGLSENEPNNIWTAFLARCIELTNSSGVLVFVLPAELLQVKFASEIRSLIVRNFQRIEIFTFNELLFKDCKGQDTIVLVGEKKSHEKGIYFCNVNKLDDLQKGKFTLFQNIKIKDSKWNHHHLENSEIELLEKLKNKLNTIDKFCSSKAGIVTAANDYFIVDNETVKEYSLQNYIKPIIQKGLFVNGSVKLTKKDFKNLVKDSKPTFLISLHHNSRIDKNKNLKNYLQIGIQREIHERYKTSIRDNWYEVPNIGTPSEAFFFKRCNEYPKLIINEANVLATDSAYVVNMKEGFEIENLVFSFYNSLSLSFAELFGRYYGGGVLELTPNEFKKLPVPYYKPISKNNFTSFISNFENKSSIKEVCNMNDGIILKSFDPNIDSNTIEKISIIRDKLFQRRMKTY